VTAAPYRLRAELGALLVCAVMLPLLSGCSVYQRVFHHGGNKNFVGCTERPFAGNADSRPALKVPEGMSAPDTRNAVKIPALSTPDPHTGKAKTEPCLAQPPNFFAQPLPLEQPKSKKSSQPANPPAPAPAPATAPAPAPATTPAPAPATTSSPAPALPAAPPAPAAPTTPVTPAPDAPSPSPAPPATTAPATTGPG
jgi:hypothetical protein